MEHNYGKKDYIWDIKPRKNIGSFPTFSEHNLEAPLHTDSQYLIKPEKYVSLFVIKKASCGGGETIVLRFEDILNTLPKSIQGKECLKILKNSLFPFATPSIFCEHESHLILAPVISNEGSIRYRFDTIKQGLRCSSFSDKEKVTRIWALNFFRKHIDNHPCILKLSLNDGEVLFLNNQKLLHGRTGFTDSNRHILRIRMNS